jgi:glyoxylase-like metal-dependent hydrolase (beta-lactamase superfamily II)
VSAGAFRALGALVLLQGLAAGPALGAGAPRPLRYETRAPATVNSWWVLTPDGGVLVFDALRTVHDARAAIARLRAMHRPVRAILLTHGHPDHVTGLATLKAAFRRSKIYAARETEAYLAGKGQDLLRLNVKDRAPGDATMRIPPADVSLDDGQRLRLGGLDIRVMMLGSGEAPGTTVYYIPSYRLAVSGDVLTPRRTPLLAAAKTANWLEQIERLTRSLPAGTMILPGHGPAARLASAAAWQSGYIRKFRAEVLTATRPGSEDGSCVSPAEARRVLTYVRRSYPANDRVALMPGEVLDGLNIEGVGFELTGRTCPGRQNPIR